nr:cutinase family protein [Nocardia takedensis]
MTATGTAVAEPGIRITGSCPALFALGVQGAEEGSVESGSDTGALGRVFGRVSAAVGDRVERAYISFGSAENGATLPYESAVAEAATKLGDAAGNIVARCPTTYLAVVGYGHGAAAAARFAERVGAPQPGLGAGRVDAGRVAVVALVANPDRASNTPVLPGRPQASTPSPAPGTSGEEVSNLALLNPATSGSGIAVPAGSAGRAPRYGSLVGRVAELCVPGDATCDTPAGSPLTTTVANIAARTDTRDPIAAISTVATALSATIFGTAVEVVDQDLSGTSLDQLSYQPTKSLGQRLAEASDPATAPPSQAEALGALIKLGTIGFNAVITVIRKVITPATIAELATVGMTNPAAAIAVLGAKLAGAAVELIPPQTANRWVNEAFTAITGTVTAPEQLYTLAGTAQYSDTTGRHGSYDTVAATPAGESTLRTVANWLIAATHDIPATPPVTPSPPTSPASTPSASTTSPDPTTKPRSSPGEPQPHSSPR